MHEMIKWIIYWFHFFSSMLLFTFFGDIDHKWIYFISNLQSICLIWTKKNNIKDQWIDFGFSLDTYTFVVLPQPCEERSIEIAWNFLCIVITIFVKEIFYTWLKAHQKREKSFASCWVLEVDLRQNIFSFLNQRHCLHCNILLIQQSICFAIIFK